MKMKNTTIITILTMLTAVSSAKVDLVTLPNRELTQLTIYNSADLTLVRDGRSLTLKEGGNKLQFSWAGTLIDPTSLSMLPKAHADKIDIADLSFPPRVKNLGLWNIDSEIGGKVPIEITYLTSGLSWRAFYMGTLTEDEKTMRLQGYVRVTNNSGEDYENAQTRLIVGKVHILDRIAELAQRQYPYGRPGEPVSMPRAAGVQDESFKMLRQAKGKVMAMDAVASAPKEIKKEGLSEYFLYTIEGTETIPNTWSKRLPSFDTDEIPVVNLYKFEQERHGPNVIRYLSFTNDTEHELGETPIPGGGMKVYRTVDNDQHLSNEGTSSFKYIPVGEEVELNLGVVSNVIVKPTLMDEKTDNYRFNTKGNIDGWDEIHSFKLEVKNTRDLPVKIEIKRHFHPRQWDIKNIGKEYTLTLDPQSEKTIEYELTTYHGTRTEDWTRKHRD
ncbi:MAG: hypothetical protein B6I25_01350 [Planctomycetales bacterium 4572_13]|nr:MAG: hypothetical protein B6I25_01350 [Planctomycetales bacterium 4572_13]